MKKSTRAFFQEADKINDFSLFERLHGYVYMRFPYLYISLAKGDHWLAKWMRPMISFFGNAFAGKQSEKVQKQVNLWAESYHGKVVTLDSAIQLVSVEQDISLENLEQIIPFEKANDIILRNPDHIAVMECPCRKGKEDPCKPLDVCLIIGEPFASFVLEHHPHTSRGITSGEARKILSEENKRGHVHHAYFKDAILDRFYAICNCCSCCCGAMQAQRNGTPMIISSGFICRVDEAKCISCGSCEAICQFQAIAMPGQPVIDEDLCMGCGVCVNQCEQGALELVLDNTKPDPLFVQDIIEKSSI